MRILLGTTLGIALGRILNGDVLNGAILVVIVITAIAIEWRPKQV